jgi:hypothetical protein
MWTFEQKTGRLFADGGILVGTGYAGTGKGRNNPAMQDVIDVGPLPCGYYTIGPAYEHPKLGKVTMNLTPDPSNQMFGRDDFRIHGNNAEDDASEGCMVQGRSVRERVNTSTDKRLRVVAEIVAPPSVADA